MASNHMRKTLLALCTLAVSAGAGAHSASDAYLNIVSTRARPRRPLRPRCYCPTRPVGYCLARSRICFEIERSRRRRADVGRGQATSGRDRKICLRPSAYRRRVGGACSIEPTRQMIDEHADGAYAALFFDVKCERSPGALRSTTIYSSPSTPRTAGFSSCAPATRSRPLCYPRRTPASP